MHESKVQWGNQEENQLVGWIDDQWNGKWEYWRFINGWLKWLPNVRWAIEVGEVWNVIISSNWSTLKRVRVDGRQLIGCWSNPKSRLISFGGNVHNGWLNLPRKEKREGSLLVGNWNLIQKWGEWVERDLSS